MKQQYLMGVDIGTTGVKACVFDLEGNVVGSAVAPCVKITGNSATYKRMEGDMDFNAGLVLEGACSQDELALRLAQMVADTAAGKMTKSEALGHKEYFIPYKYQEKDVVLPCQQ